MANASYCTTGTGGLETWSRPSSLRGQRAGGDEGKSFCANVPSPGTGNRAVKAWGMWEAGGGGHGADIGDALNNTDVKKEPVTYISIYR